MTKTEFIKKCNKARKLTIEATEIVSQLLDSFSDDILEAESDAENADDIQTAITCFIQYGEYSPEEIWEEITKIQKGE